MAGTILYDYDPGQAVWVITEPISTSSACPDQDSAVIAGTIIQVKASILTSTPLVGSPVASVEPTYDVRLESDTGTQEFIQDDIFPSLTLAIDEYEVRLAQ